MSQQGKEGYLVVARCVGQSIIIGDNVTITVHEIRPGQVKLSVQAPRSIPVDRQEVRDRKNAQRDRVAA